MLERFTNKSAEPTHFSALRRVSLFSTLKKREIRTIDSLLHRREYIKDEIIFDELEEGQAVYFVISGKVLVCKQGQPVHGAIAELEAGQCFGELALLYDAPRSAQVRAAEDCSLAVLFREDFLNLLNTHAVIASKVSLQLALLLGQRVLNQNQRHQTNPL